MLKADNTKGNSKEDPDRFDLYDTEEMEDGRIINQLDILKRRLNYINTEIIGDISSLPTISDQPGLINIVNTLYKSVRMMDVKHAKDVEQRFRFLQQDLSIAFSKDKSKSSLSAEDKTQFNNLKEKLMFLVENKDLMEEVLLRIEKENDTYEEIAEVANQFK